MSAQIVTPECFKPDLAGAFINIEPKLLDIERMARVAHGLANDDLHEKELVYFIVGRLREMTQDFVQEYYRLWGKQWEPDRRIFSL